MAERGSDKHGSRLDDEMSDEVEALVRSGREPRAAESRSMEGAADGEPVTDFRTSSASEPTGPNTISAQEAEERGFLADNLDLRTFPADKETLIASAKEKFAPDEVVERLQALPSGRRFETVAEVWEALGGRTEHRLETPSGD
jgi:hypothetical protein